MCYELKTSNGNSEAVIDDNCGISKFYKIAETLSSDLHVTFLNQVDDADTLDWDFHYKNNLLTLHYSIFNGVSILPQQVNKNAAKNNVVMEVAHFLQQRAY
jgi:hypothetical protein